MKRKDKGKPPFKKIRVEDESAVFRKLRRARQPIDPPVAEPPSLDEKRIVHHYRTLRARIHDGPLYCVLNDNVRLKKDSTSVLGKRKDPPAAHFDPFEQQPTYTQKYRKKLYTLPRLHTRPFVKELFPKELWATIDPSDRSHVRRRLAISTRTRLDRFLANVEGEEDDDDEGENVEEVVEKERDEDEVDEEEEIRRQREDVDGEVEHYDDEDDEDEDDDYNAEQYFEGGEDDEYPDDGGGDETYA